MLYISAAALLPACRGNASHHCWQVLIGLPPLLPACRSRRLAQGPAPRPPRDRRQMRAPQLWPAGVRPGWRPQAGHAPLGCVPCCAHALQHPRPLPGCRAPRTLCQPCTALPPQCAAGHPPPKDLATGTEGAQQERAASAGAGSREGACGVRRGGMRTRLCNATLGRARRYNAGSLLRLAACTVRRRGHWDCGIGNQRWLAAAGNGVPYRSLLT